MFIMNGMLSVRLLGSIAPTKKPCIVISMEGVYIARGQESKATILRKTFAVKQVELKNVQSNV